MTVLGAVLLPHLLPEQYPAIAADAEEAGLEELWLWEDCFLTGGLSTASAILAQTQRLRVGIGVLPVPMRNVAITAMETATVCRMFPGRLTLGIGHGVQDWMGQIGARVASPVTLLREYTTALRQLLDGEQVTTTGRYVNLDRVALDHPPLQPTTIHLAAEGPRTLELSGELADGTVLAGGTTLDGLRTAKQHIDIGRGRGERADHEIVVYVQTATGADADERMQREYAHWGQDPADEIGLTGNASDIAAGVDRWVHAGADRVILQPTHDDPDPTEFFRFVAQDVRPLV